MSWDGQRPPLGFRAFMVRVRWTQIDWMVMLVALVLLAVGMVFQSAMAEVDAAYLRESPTFASHVKKVVVAVPILLAGLVVRPRWLRRNSYLVYALSIVLLMLVPLIGDVRNNAKRWIELPFGFDLQPSELAKIALVLALARAFYRNRLQTVEDWLGAALLALLPMALVAKQPDLGTALSIAPITLGMAYLAGAKGKTIAGLVLSGALALGFAWHFELIEDYQKRRVDTWLQAFDSEELIADRKGASYHTYLARVAIGNGGWAGQGLGQGIANQTGHLPERGSDSIFAVIAEEGGLLGATWLLGLYLLLVALILRRAGSIRERFSRLVVGGVALVFGSHVFLHCGVMLGLLPLTGLTLPLVSTGGSSLLASFGALGLALGLGTHHEPALDSDSFRP
ncbi:MAG: FtsW/RodA/SpoVE family cell cycle protein [Planctomycetota bacterium]